MPHCEDYLEHISAAVDGELSPQQRARLEAHLAQCPACRALLDDLTALHDGLGALPQVTPPQGLDETIMAAVRDSSVTPFPAKKPLYWKKWLSSAAVLALIVAAGWGWRAGTFGGASSMAGAPNAATGRSADAADPLPENAAEAAPADSGAPAESRMRTAQPPLTSPGADAVTAEGDGTYYGTSGSQDMSAITQAKTAVPDAPPAEPSAEAPASIAPRMFSVQGGAPADDPAVGQTNELDEGLTDETDPGLPAAFSLTSAPPPEGETTPEEESPAPAGGSGIAPLTASAPLTAEEAVKVLANYIYEFVGEVEPLPASEEDGAIVYTVDSPTGVSGSITLTGEDETLFLLEYRDSEGGEALHYTVDKADAAVTWLDAAPEE